MDQADDCLILFCINYSDSHIPTGRPKIDDIQMAPGHCVQVYPPREFLVQAVRKTLLISASFYRIRSRPLTTHMNLHHFCSHVTIRTCWPDISFHSRSVSLISLSHRAWRIFPTSQPAADTQYQYTNSSYEIAAMRYQLWLPESIHSPRKAA